MRISVNGKPCDVHATTLADLIVELACDRPAVATAHNEVFVPAPERAALRLRDGDRVEILSPRQGG